MSRKKSIFSFFVALLLFSPGASAQNLVQNPGFEDYSYIANNYSLVNDIHRYLKNWYCPIDATPDYFHRKAKKNVSVPKNFMGSQKPHSGDAYIGMILMYNNGSEYLQSKLSKTLKKDSLYCLSLYISLADKSTHKVDKAGMHLSGEKFRRKGWHTLSNKAHIENPSGRMLEDTTEWMLVKGLYKAKGGESYVTFGNFSARDSSNYTETFVNEYFKQFEHNAYYYIDDIGVIPFDENNETVCTFGDYFTATDIKPSYVITVRDTIILENLLFETDRADQPEKVYRELFPLVLYMRLHPEIHVNLYGHTDNTGGYQYNIKLSYKRAENVEDFLLEHQIENRRVHVYGFGDKVPIATNKTEKGKQENRRVEFMLYYP